MFINLLVLLVHMWPFALMLPLYSQRGGGKIKFISDSETYKYLSYKDHISTEEVTVFSANINSNFYSCRVFLPTLMLTPINS